MRKLLLTVLLAASFTGVFAQKLDDVKEKLDKKKYDEAKEKIDKAFTDPKAATNSEAWFYKAKIYHNLAKAKPEDAALSAAALEAMKKYMDMEQGKAENMRMLMSTLENHQTFYDIYQDYFKIGVQDFQNQKYENALVSFKGALDAFDYLAKYKLTTLTFDTTVTVYAGFAAQNAKQYDQAAGYYDKLIMAKVRDTSYIDAYRFLINYNLDTKKDTAAALRYLQISESAFPKHEDLWIDYEMIVMGNDRAKKIARYDELSLLYPNNFVVALNHAVELYNSTFFGETKTASYPSEQAATKKALERALALDANSPQGNYIMSQFYVNQIYDLEDSVRAIRGTTPADVARKKDLNAKMDARYEDLFTYSTKTFELYSKEESHIKAQDKANYRRTINQLIDYHTRKKQTDKVTLYQDKLKQLK